MEIKVRDGKCYAKSKKIQGDYVTIAVGLYYTGTKISLIWLYHFYYHDKIKLSIS